MKKICVLLAALALLGACSRPAHLKVASYNIRYANRGDSLRGFVWGERGNYIFEQLRYEAPDVFGCQEVLARQLDDMAAALPEYDYVGVGRDDGARAGEHEPVFWRKDRFGLLDKGWFWLSETPDQPGKGWDAACVRICTWAYLKDKCSGKKLWVFNLHMDHVGVVARAESAKLIVRQIEQRCKPSEAVFVMGDFNVDQTDGIFATFTQSEVLTDTYERALHRFTPTGTFNSFRPDSFTTARIDHIFVSPIVTVEEYAIRTDTYRTALPEDAGYEARVLSDHFPVFVKVSF